jgi:triacylglycerol esterase/lipase EstA (alpha/beta hydrolase family)
MPRTFLGRLTSLWQGLSPEPAPSSDDVAAAGADPLLRQELKNSGHTLAYLRHLVRGNRIRRKSFYERVSEEHPPVLLIHGFMGTRGSMYILERRLNQDGLCVFSFDLGPINLRDIRQSAVLIHRKIDSILSQVPVHKIDIVGHSMGGLIGLYYVKKLGGHAKVRRLVMMGTPQAGTWSALLGVASIGLVSASSWQILPRSSFLAELAEGPLPREVEYVTIAAQRDWVCPPGSTYLPGARRIAVPFGHSSLVMSEEVYRHVRKALRE